MARGSCSALPGSKVPLGQRSESSAGKELAQRLQGDFASPSTLRKFRVFTEVFAVLPFIPAPGSYHSLGPSTLPPLREPRVVGEDGPAPLGSGHLGRPPQGPSQQPLPFCRNDTKEDVFVHQVRAGGRGVGKNAPPPGRPLPSSACFPLETACLPGSGPLLPLASGACINSHWLHMCHAVCVRNALVAPRPWHAHSPRWDLLFKNEP